MTITLQGLPQEVTLNIFKYLDTQDLTHRINLVCKAFQDLSDNDNLWREETIRKFGFEAKQETGSSSWKETYRLRLPVFYDGSLMNIMKYEAGKRIGNEHPTYYTNGSLKYIFHYETGILNGLFVANPALQGRVMTNYLNWGERRR